MIAESENSSREIINACRSSIQVDTLGQNMKIIFDDFARSATSEKFPGAVLVDPSMGSPNVFYAIAPKPEHWRVLQPLLISYAGPTFSTFDGKVIPLDQSSDNPLEKFLVSKERNWYRTTKIIPGSGDLEESCSESLSLMVKNYLNAPDTSKETPKTTEQLIAKFTDALDAKNNREEAENIIQVCKKLCRLDTPNLNFMKVKMYSHFNEWGEIINFDNEDPFETSDYTTSHTFKTLCNSKKTKFITSMLLESIYQTYFSHIEVKNKISEEDIRNWKNLRPNEESRMLKSQIPKCILRGGLTLYVLELHELRRKVESFEKDGDFTKVKNLKVDFNKLLQATKYVSQDFDGFSSFLSNLKPYEEKPKYQEHTADINKDKFSEAIKILRRFDKQSDLAGDVESRKWLEKLKIELRDKLEKSELTRDSLQSLEEESQEPVPESWSEFFGLLGDPEFKSYYKKLELAVDEWPVSELKDPEKILELNESLEKIKGSEQTFYERFPNCIPLLASWLGNDPDPPHIGLSDLYDNLLYHIVVGVERGGQVFNSTEKLIGALLSLGLSKGKYKDLLNNCIELSKGIGTAQISWALKILDYTYQWPCPDENERELFFHEIYNEIEKNKQFLSEGQILIIKAFHTTPGWINRLEPIPEDKNSKLRGALSGKNVKTIAIYSLTENALRRASEIIEKMTNIKVHTSHDKVGNPRLEGLAKTADIFIIAVSSAKHAATQCITNNRPKEKTTLWADGTGFTSIISALEEKYV